MEYAKIEKGNLVYATFKNGALVTDTQLVWCSGNDYSKYGYYPVQNITEDGVPTLDEEQGVILNYIGSPVPPLELTEEDIRDAQIKSQLADTAPLFEAIERLLALLGTTAEDRLMAQDRITLRDSLGKPIVTEEGDGTPFNPYVWIEGKAVTANMWYKTPSDYIWMAIADGVPESEIDSEYFDVVGI